MLVTVFAIVFSLSCALLAQWQFSRLEGRRRANALIQTNYQAATAPLTSVLAPGKPWSPALTWRAVTVKGTYDTSRQVLLRRRVLNGADGFWVLTGMTTPTGLVWAVRGWIPAGPDARTSPSIPASPTGEVTISGHLTGPERSTTVQGLPAGQQQTAGPTELTALARGARAFPALVLVDKENPAADPSPRRIPAPSLDDGPHLSYAIQWIVFAFAGWIGWWVIVTRMREDDTPVTEGSH